MTIDRTRWQRLSSLLDEALALDADERARWLEALREQDAGVAAALESLLADAGKAEPEASRLGADFDKQLGAALDSDASPATLHAGSRFGPWELLRKIGAGGMGEVWLARRADGLYDAQAAIKLLRSDLAAAGLLQERFARERLVLARLNHPAVARLLDAGIEGGQAYLVLEHVDGRGLAEHVRERCPTVADRVRLLLRIAEAVDHAHAQLIVHRDLKPSNVLVTRDGAPKLLDFGIAALLDDGMAASSDLTRQTGRGLTLGYAAPEQILGAPIRAAGDVFSLGVMLYELLAGTLPFAPRDAARLAAEHAVLHAEPRRLGAPQATALTPADLQHGPGLPTDAVRALGDLEAVAAKALRKDPADRYGSVRLLMADLQAWLDHRPVAARHEDWRHRTRLWLRRHALLAGSAAAVLLALVAGLAATTWQWRRAEAAAHQSDQVTAYLTDMLASASPDRHKGEWPTVLQLLETSRAALPQKFRDDPDTRLRLLEVMADTYHQLNRFDISMPLREEQIALSTQRLGAGDARTLEAQFQLARSQQVLGLSDKVIATLEPLLPRFAAAWGTRSEDYRDMLYVLSNSYGRAGRLDDADRMLAEAGLLTDALYPPGAPERLSHLNHLNVLRIAQGRLRDAEAALKLTEPYWTAPALAQSQLPLVLRRNTLAVKIRLAEYDGSIEARTPPLLADMDRLLGPGNDMAIGMRNELARYYAESGQLDKALAQRRDNLARAEAAHVEHPASLLPLRVHVLAAEARAHAQGDAALARQARVLWAALQRNRDDIGYAWADLGLNLVRVALVIDDAGLAGEILVPLKAAVAARLSNDAPFAGRLTQVDGEVARLQGDLPRSRTLLGQRWAGYAKATEPEAIPAWAAALDLAWTLTLMGDPGAAAALDAAAARRPAGVPPGHPLDGATKLMRASLATASLAAPATGRGSLGGVLY